MAMRWHHYAVVGFTVLFGVAAILVLVSGAGKPIAGVAQAAGR